MEKDRKRGRKEGGKKTSERAGRERKAERVRGLGARVQNTVTAGMDSKYMEGEAINRDTWNSQSNKRVIYRPQGANPDPHI